MFYSERLVEEIFASAFQQLSAQIRQPGQPFGHTLHDWHTFFDSLIVTYVTGEQPSPTDSGLTFARKARKVLGIAEERILMPRDALEQAHVNPDRPILFVDDFVGSGSQFIETWERSYELSTGVHSSFSVHASKYPGSHYYYCLAMCTSYGHDRIIQSSGSRVIVTPGNWLVSESSALHPQSTVWPSGLNASGPAFVETASARAGIPDTGGGENDWRGFHKLGLTLGFADSTPDATLPLFYWEKNGWKPLVRRR